MKFLEKLTTRKKILQRTIGLHFDQLNLLVIRLEKYWLEAEFQRKASAKRRRKSGAGRPYKFQELAKKVLIVLLYYKLYITQEFLGLIVGLDQANVSRLLKKMLPLIEKAADPELATYLTEAKEAYSKQDPSQKINDWIGFLKRYPELKDASTDATEQKRYRSQNYEQQKTDYSGKRKHHSLKTQISIASTGRILDVSKTYPGSIHDKTIIDQEKTVQKFPERTCQRFDLGYQGVASEYPESYIVLPVKKPRKKELSDLAKELNQSHSRRRVIAEHGIARIKKFRICGNVYRGVTESYNQTFRNIAAILNFKLANPAIC